jgi:hypothetical protein
MIPRIKEIDVETTVHITKYPRHYCEKIILKARLKNTYTNGDITNISKQITDALSDKVTIVILETQPPIIKFTIYDVKLLNNVIGILKNDECISTFEYEHIPEKYEDVEYIQCTDTPNVIKEWVSHIYDYDIIKFNHKFYIISDSDTNIINIKQIVKGDAYCDFSNNILVKHYRDEHGLSKEWNNFVDRYKDERVSDSTIKNPLFCFYSAFSLYEVKFLEKHGKISTFFYHADNRVKILQTADPEKLYQEIFKFE